MKSTLGAVLLCLCACEGQPLDEAADSTQFINEFGNETSSGFPADRYRVEDCQADIPLQPPFRASDDGWGKLAVRVPLSLLDNPGETNLAPEGPSDQHRLSFGPLGVRAAELREEIEGVARLSGGPPKTIDTFERRAAQRAPLDGLYLGELAPNRRMAIRCLGHALPNPWCEAEVETASGMRFLAKFPHHAAHRLVDIIAIGDRLFAEVLPSCPPASHNASG